MPSPAPHPDLRVVPPNPAGAWFVFAALLLAIAAAALVLARQASEPAAVARQLWPMLAVMALVFVLLAVAINRYSVEIRDGRLLVRAGLHTCRTPLADLDLDAARVVDLAERTELRPMLKVGGTGLPGFRAGWFRMRGGFRKGFYLLTATRNVLWLPRRDGVQLLLSMASPVAALSRLRKAAREPTHARG